LAPDVMEIFGEPHPGNPRVLKKGEKKKKEWGAPKPPKPQGGPQKVGPPEGKDCAKSTREGLNPPGI